MTPNQIKALAKQAGGATHTTMGDRVIIFLPDALNEFVRLVREQALRESKAQRNVLEQALTTLVALSDLDDYALDPFYFAAYGGAETIAAIEEVLK